MNTEDNIDASEEKGKSPNADSGPAPRKKRKGDAGKRRQGREMAVQMLFQWEASETHPSEVLRAFDLSLYQAETARGIGDPDAEPKAEAARGEGNAVVNGEREDPRRRDRDDVELGDEREEAELDDIDRRRELARKANVERQINVQLGPKARSKAYQFARSLLLGVVENRKAIDEAIAARADNWRIERMPRVDRNILRTALYEAMFLQELPKAVIIDEAIELAKKFGGENSGAFVNGLLDGLLA